MTGADGSVTLTYDAAGLSEAVKAKFPQLAEFAAFKLPADFDAATALKGQIVVSVETGAVNAAAADFAADATGVQIPGVLDALFTYTGDLGVVWAGDVPTIRLWAPTAKSVKLHIFDTATSTPAAQIVDMTAGESGTWSATGDAAWNGKYYLFEVEVYVPSTGQVENNIVTDPYAVSLSMNSTRSQIINLDDPALMPPGWTSLQKPPLAAPEDITLYELHVRDFSARDATVPDDVKGTFKAFTLPESDGVKHLQALADAGLTHVHLLPSFDIATINEDKSAWLSPNIPAGAAPDGTAQRDAVNAVRDEDGFNWGYDPFHYTVPEGSYSTDPNGTARILEFREMVQALNAMGLRVVMDVVYNHTNASGQGEKSVLDKIVPGYYHRLNADGAVETSTCCQNTATEHAMMEKLMVDSLKVWASAYKVDGFRFDLMGHHMVSNMEAVQSALAAIDPTIYIYGEGWNFGEVADGARGENATQLNLAGTGIGTFNDRLRDAVRGGGPFDEGAAIVTNQGFISGIYYAPNGSNSGSDAEKAEMLLSADQIRVGLAGNLADYEFVDRNGNTVKGSEVDYNGAPAGYTEDPQEHIVYVSAHDNETLWDITQFKLAADTSLADRVRVQNLGMDFTLLAQGVPFLHAGVDVLRSKSLDRDSYNSGDWFNYLDWTYQTNNWGVGLPPVSNAEEATLKALLSDAGLAPGSTEIQAANAHAREMLAIRESSPLFRLRSADEVQARLKFHNTGPNQAPGVIVMSISDEVAGLDDIDPEHELIVVVFNANDEAQSVTVPEFGYKPIQLHPNQVQSSDAVVRTASVEMAGATFTVPARTTAVFVQLTTPTALDGTAAP
ncbi:MAG: pullulanase-type alpha-1,6-glucosidase, partial [Caldilineaceae bacterium]